MKKLELNQMENLNGGVGSGTTVINGIGVACVGIGLVAAAGSFFTFGASLAFGVAIGGAFCTGAGAGALAYTLSH